MGQGTSELWRELWDRKGTRREYAFEVGGDGSWARYGPEAVVGHSVSQSLYETFGFGNAASAKLTLRVAAESIPRAAQIRRFVRLVNGGDASEWRPAGIFFANRRSEEDGVWTVEAFDCMRKGEAVWVPFEGEAFPMSMGEAAFELAWALGTELDARTALNEAYSLDYPAEETTVRQVLQYIAAAHGGNWIVTGEGRLLLVPLGSEPPETHYLVTERGRAITLGGVRILV